ncbi:hypothetical protein C0991_011527, partial [Blastosporella zonata]
HRDRVQSPPKLSTEPTETEHRPLNTKSEQTTLAPRSRTTSIARDKQGHFIPRASEPAAAIQPNPSTDTTTIPPSTADNTPSPLSSLGSDFSFSLSASSKLFRSTRGHNTPDSQSDPATPPTSPVRPDTPVTVTPKPNPNPMYQPTIAMFHGGEDQTDENPQDFINSIRRMFHGGTYSDEQKVEFLELSLKGGGPATAWFEGLSREAKATWTSVYASFITRWPPVREAVKTRQDKQDELANTRIEEDELGKKITSRGVEVYTHVAWANKVQRLAEGIPDTGNLLVKATRDDMAPSLRSLIPHSSDTWSTFCDSVRAISITELREKMEEKKVQRKMQEQLEEVRKAATRQPMPQTPSKALAASLSRVQLRTPIPAPSFRPTQPPAGVYNRNQPATSSRAGRTDEEKWAIIQQLPHPPANTDANRAAYTILLANWRTANPGAERVLEDRPIPLTPGTVPLGSGECTGCGMMGHVWSSCSSTLKLPEIEQQWRRKVGSIQRAVSRSTTNVNLVTEEDVFFGFTAEQIRGILAEHIAAQDQGKGLGLSE